jgi:hypothetical protein
LLTGKNRAFVASGIYGADEGRVFAIYPKAQAYLVAIRTKPDGCEIAGRATLTGNALTVTAYHLSFSARLMHGRILNVMPEDRASVVEEASCGTTGTIAVAYTRIEP